ncbi:hypothetical protein [Actinomadura nitritigenes]|uniref:hypothetical protein n=1 Tax=Actinomadura nitritigenes TaxID=134602 RepID=UPI003D8C989E
MSALASHHLAANGLGHNPFISGVIAALGVLIFANRLYALLKKRRQEPRPTTKWAPTDSRG